ncbi:MAG: hypothetical protein AAGI24_11170 [Pseudomonadota bacterium]
MFGSTAVYANLEQTYQRDGRELRLLVDDSVPDKQQDDILRWIDVIADSMASVFGHWPRRHLEVRVVSYQSAGNDPVPWAQVNRGDQNPDSPNVVSFYVDPGADFTRLAQNWTAYHEFSHLLIPYRGWGDMWFSEGLASYYQNLLQARSGIFDEREMWQRLHDGFVRGRDNKRPDMTLAELSPSMREHRSYMRVYWSGAWYFFRADTELRSRSGGTQSLDTALAALNECCADMRLLAREIASRLDQLSGEAVFLPLFDQVAASYGLPAFEALYRELGIGIDASGTVTLQPSHPQAPLRRAIAAGS